MIQVMHASRSGFPQWESKPCSAESCSQLFSENVLFFYIFLLLLFIIYYYKFISDII